MMRRLVLMFIILHALTANAQTFSTIDGGSIYFERRIKISNKSRVAGKEEASFRTTNYILKFTKEKALYTPSKNNQFLDRIGLQPAENNIVYSDKVSGNYLSLKNVFDEKYVVADTFPYIKWKITSEKRVIAGLECRRANAIIFDSVYVVAFYTDDIPLSLGPELFNGLPGMILAVSLPHLHIHMTATAIKNELLTEPFLTKGNVERSIMSAKQLEQKLKESYSNWGEEKLSYLIQSLF